VSQTASSGAEGRDDHDTACDTTRDTGPGGPVGTSPRVMESRPSSAEEGDRDTDDTGDTAYPHQSNRAPF